MSISEAEVFNKSFAYSTLDFDHFFVLREVLDLGFDIMLIFLPHICNLLVQSIISCLESKQEILEETAILLHFLLGFDEQFVVAVSDFQEYHEVQTRLNLLRHVGDVICTWSKYIQSLGHECVEDKWKKALRFFLINLGSYVNLWFDKTACEYGHCKILSFHLRTQREELLEDLSDRARLGVQIDESISCFHGQFALCWPQVSQIPIAHYLEKISNEEQVLHFIFGIMANGLVRPPVIDKRRPLLRHVDQERCLFYTHELQRL